MKRRDLIFLFVIVAILAVLLASTLREQPRPLPDDERHRPFAVLLRQGTVRTEVEQGCVTCHHPRQRPLPADHPPKEQCLLCHQAAG